GLGTIYRVTTNGALTKLAEPAPGYGLQGPLFPAPDGALYGLTSYGGASNYGTVFRVTTNGVLTTLFSFDFTSGANPFGGLLLGSDGMFYGTTFRGGAFGGGTVFKFSPAGLSIQSISGDRVVVSWIDPTHVVQSAPNAPGAY